MTESELRKEFWTEIAKSPFIMVQLDSNPRSSVPMTAQLHKDVPGKIWFFTNRDGPLATMGPATAIFVAKDHRFFARIAGHLVEEKDRSILDKLWTNAVAAWFPEGKDSPDLLLMQMVLGEASLWEAKMGPISLTKMLLGASVAEDLKGHHANTSL